MKHIVVIGAGIGGLATAALLARDGFRVTIIEKNDQPGGRAGLWEKNGFRFDMGPSWYLMQDVFETFFKEFNHSPSDFLTLKRLDPAYRLFFGKDTHYDITASLEKNRALFASLEENGAEKFDRYLNNAAFQYNASMEKFIYKDYKTMRDFLSRDIMLLAPRLNLLQGIDDYVKGYFKNDIARKILEYNIVFLGGSPKNTPALYSLMAHIDFNMGVWYPMGGIYELIKAMVHLAESYGVKCRYNLPAVSIVTENDKTSGVMTKKGLIKADIVVANADYHHVETELLDRESQSYPEKYWKSRVMAPSAFMLFLGINKRIKKLSHHNLFFAHDWMQHFNSIFDAPSWPKSPSYYVSCPSKTDPTVAPKGMENLFILVPVAPGLKDTPAIRKQYRDMILSDLEKTIGESVTDSIVVERSFAHNDFSERYNAYKGSALGLTHTLFQTALWRPQHRSKKIHNLFYTGAYTHPGIGMPMCLISAQIVEKEIQHAYS